MQIRKIAGVLIVYAGFAMQPLLAGELEELYRKALQNDPQYAAAVALRDAAQQLVPMARAAFLPRIGVGASYGRTNTERDALDFFGGRKKTDYEYYPENYSVTLTQPLLRPAVLAEYAQAKWRTEQANADFDKRADDLKQRLVEAYLRVLLSSARLRLIEQQKSTYSELLKQAERSYAAGYGTVTEVAESQSRLDELLSEEVTARALNANQLAVLRQIIGIPAYNVPNDQFAEFVANLHGGNTLEDWKAIAVSHAPELQLEQARVKGAEAGVDKVSAAFLPTLDLRLQYSRDKNPGYSSEGMALTSNSAVLSLNIPVFEGGYTLAQLRQANAQLNASQENYRAISEGLAVEIEKEYGNVTSFAVRIQALQRSVQTNELLVKATGKSVDAGIRTNVDTLNAQSRLFEARLKLSESRLNYLISLLRLKVAVGQFSDSDFEALDRLLFPVN